MSEKIGISEQDLEQVAGGVTAAPTPTGGVVYQCTACGASINASTRDMSVTCPNLKCRCQFHVRNGKLIAVAGRL